MNPQAYQSGATARNTSANAISGTFANLPDGAILTVNGNTFQTSYAS